MDIKVWADLVNTIGIPGVMLYLFYKDFVKPRRNARNGKPAGFSPPGNPGNGYARESDVANLADSFREHRAKTEEQLGEIRERMVRVETRVEEHLKRSEG